MMKDKQSKQTKMSEDRAAIEPANDAKDPRIDPNDPHDKALLENLQGNIIKGHDRDHAVLIFLHFNTKFSAKIKATIREQVAEKKKVTSAWLQFQETQRYRKYGIPGGIFINFLLTATGYRALGYDVNGFTDQGFRRGMLAQETREKLNDPEPWRLEESYRQDSQNKEIHAMILLADDDASYLGRQVRVILNEMIVRDSGDLATLVAIEHGFQQRDNLKQPIEHFGFRDGLSNPMFLTTDDETIDQYGGRNRWDPRASRELVLVRDPLSKDNSFGSYCVYRKLEQHVRAFEVQVRNLAQGLRLNSENEEDLEFVRSLIVGRFRDGTPVALRDSPYGQRYGNDNYNNFNYDDDAIGSHCPLHAHIRKVNQRDATGKLQDRRIARRGITYGTRSPNEQGIDSLPNTGLGLLFMCFQNSIETKFEAIQSEMANASQFPEKGVGLDPIIGQLPDDTRKGPPTWPDQRWPMEWGKSKSYYDAFASCVSLQGGEYFFAPSLSFLREMP